jgi:hypothetical protein
MGRLPARAFNPSKQALAVGGICASTTTTPSGEISQPMVPPWPTKLPTFPRIALNSTGGNPACPCPDV